MFRKIILLILIFNSINSLYCNFNNDTIPNNFIQAQLVVTNEIDLMPLKNAIELLEMEKIDEGIMELNSFYHSLLITQNFNSLQGYYGLELYNLTKLAIDENLKKKNKKLLEKFIYQAFITQKYQVLNDIESRLKKNKVDEIPNRILLLTKALEGSVGEYNDVIQSILKVNPTLISVNSLLADIYLADSLYDKSIVLYDKCLSLDPNSAYVHYKKSFAYKFKNDTIKQEASLKKSLDLYYQNDLALKEYGILQFHKANYEEATTLFKSCININQEDFSSYYYLSKISFIQNEFAQAINYCDKVLEYFPDDVSTLLTKAKANILLGNFEEAKNDLSRIILLEENDIKAYILNSFVLFELGETDKALENSRKAVKLDPKNPILNENLASIYFHILDLDSAKLYYKRSYELEDNLKIKLENLNSYLYCYTKEISLSKEIKEFEENIDCTSEYCFEHDLINKPIDYKLRLKLIEILKNHSLKDVNSNINLYIGNFYENSKNELAKIYYLKAIEIDSLNFYAHYGLAQTERRLDNYLSSMEQYEKTLELNPDHTSSFGNLGWVSYLAKDYEKCIHYSKKAIANDENAFYAKFNIALANLMKGDFEEAKKLYTQYKKEALSKNRSLLTARIDLKAALKEGQFENEIKKILNDVFLDYNYERNMTIDY